MCLETGLKAFKVSLFFGFGCLNSEPIGKKTKP